MVAISDVGEAVAIFLVPFPILFGLRLFVEWHAALLAKQCFGIEEKALRMSVSAP